SISRPAIGPPMRPVPMNPIVGFVILHSSHGRVRVTAPGILQAHRLRKNPGWSDSPSSTGFGQHAAEGEGGFWRHWVAFRERSMAIAQPCSAAFPLYNLLKNSAGLPTE